MEAQIYQESKDYIYRGHYSVLPLEAELKMELSKYLRPIHYEYRDVYLRQQVN